MPRMRPRLDRVRERVLVWGVAGLGLLTATCAREPWDRVAWPVGYYQAPLPERLPAPVAIEEGGRRAPWPYAPVVPVWAAADGMPYARAVQQAAYHYRLPEPLVWAVIKAESNFANVATSSAGAQGLMQLMPRTADAMGVGDAFDPVQNIFGGARYLRYLANRFDGDLRLTIAAYNAGPGAVRKHGGVPPYRETRTYLERVLHFYRLCAAPASGVQAAR